MLNQIVKTLFGPNRITRCLKCQKRNNSSQRSVNLSYYSYEKNVNEDQGLQPVLILHGMMGSKQNWQSLAKIIGKSGRKVIAVDARNHGESEWREEMDYFLFRDDLLRLMDLQTIYQAVLIGHSMGGKTAMVTALTIPERVAGLVVVDIAPAESPNISNYPGYLQAMLKIPLAFMEDGSHTPLSKVRNYVIDELAKAVKDEAMRHFLASNLIIKDNKFTWKCNLDSIINNFSTLGSFPGFPTHIQYMGRTLFIGGSRSDYIQEKHYPLIRSLFPRAEIQHIQNAGHWVHSDQPSNFVKVVNDFLRNAGL